MVVERQVIGWFQVQHEDPQVCSPDGRFPVFLIQHGDDGGHYYGFPQFGHAGLKIGKFDHAPGVATHPDKLSREITPEDEQVQAQYA